MSTSMSVAEEWHRMNICGDVIPDEVPLAETYRFAGPPMSFGERDGYLSALRTAGPAWLTGGGDTEVVTQYGAGEWFTTVFTFHSATSDQRVTGSLTSRVVDGLVCEDYFAYDPRVAYNQVDGLFGRLEQMLGDVPGATYGLP